MAEDRTLTVTEAMTRAKGALEGIRVSVVGEVSEFADKPGYKAAYFTVCDSGTSMSCLMWRDIYESSGVSLRCGMLIELSGHFSAYLPKGRMQFIVRSLRLAGEGTLRLQVAQLARRLEAEGLMAPERKRTPPRIPSRIGVVTSPRGKAVHDVLRTLRRRFPLAEVVVAGVAVEGVGAPDEIKRAIELCAAQGPDVILLVRGGGSYEDLMPFNSEVVARAVVACPVPVVSGIGHEPDTTLADMVADVRASTPTAAAEASAPSVAELREALRRERRLLGRALIHRLDGVHHRIERIQQRPLFKEAHALLGQREQLLDSLGIRLRQSLPRRLGVDATAVEVIRGRMVRIGRTLVERHSRRVDLAGCSLRGLSPLAILERGYAVATTTSGQIIRDPESIREGDEFTVRVARGRIEGVAKSTTREEP